MSVISIFTKAKRVFKNKGVAGLCAAALGKIQRSYRRKCFRVAGGSFANLNLKRPHRFEKLSFDDIDLKNYPASKIFGQIQSNCYQILESELRNWGRSNVAGHLHWHMDLVRNFEWSSKVAGVELSIPLNGGDVKRPWELGRLHQLVQLALCYRCFRDDEERRKSCQQLATTILCDFHESNPVFNGPQWMCAMDVGIRLSNICLAADIFGEEFVSLNQKVLDYELARHIFFIESNKENSLGSFVGNHYLANICGLVYGYAHSGHKRASYMLRKVSKELNFETIKQFGNDGGNFEGSTYYHRLSGELVVFAFACLLKRSDSKIEMGLTFLERLKAILFFSESVSLVDGFVPQVGDNDSGHLLICNPIQFQENDLNHRSFICGLRHFFQLKDKNQFLEVLVSEYCNADNGTFLVPEHKAVYGSEKEFLRATEKCFKLNSKQEYNFSVAHFDPQQASYFSFSDFGIYTCKFGNVFVSLRCGVNSNDKGGGHRHRDQLSIFIHDGRDIVGRDPGTYLYTSDTAMRALLRSASAHNGPYCGTGLRVEASLFEMNDQFAQCIYFGPLGFFGKSFENGKEFCRWISFSEENIKIIDWVESGEELARLDFAENLFSPGYGQIAGVAQ
ncbi:heparinase II/III family protein [Bdellovibrio sp. HCB288]|uniref:heparinase II/III domain-containing protein n=1 Tax=Bdellovibrio sp. HCB288 TaxID=3394355 RepID=UPI0039B56D52